MKLLVKTGRNGLRVSKEYIAIMAKRRANQSIAPLGIIECDLGDNGALQLGSSANPKDRFASSEEPAHRMNCRSRDPYPVESQGLVCQPTPKKGAGYAV
jgi:hypothetical protein